jgi:hypothetical protein
MGLDRSGFCAVNQGVICFLVVDSMLLFGFNGAFCGGNWVARGGIRDHGGHSPTLNPSFGGR